MRLPGFEQLEERRLLTLTDPIVNMPGLDTGAQPPDPVLDVGTNHVIQMVNATEYQIWDKQGVVLTPPSDFGALWASANPQITPDPGNQCQTNLGDPIVVFDHLADRWLLSQFHSSGMCIAISQVADPVVGGDGAASTGDEWFLYRFDTPEFPDYPKIGVWPDGYYVTTNESSPANYVFDRVNMLQGLAPRGIQRFAVPPLAGFGFNALTPADLDGPAPAADTPAIFMRQRDDELHNPGVNDPTQDFLEMWEFTADLDNPGNSTFTQLASIPVADFDSDFTRTTPPFGSLPQPGTAVTLDPIPEVIMYRLQYRNFGTHETLVGNFTIDVDGTDHAGIRWFELRRTGGSWSLHQEGTIAPDANNRWMGSIAMDGEGNIAVGYSTGSANLSAGLRYTGRLATDPLGTMPQGERILVSGVGFNPTDRWGDYATMSVDPVDDSTFWFTGEYADDPAGGNATQVGSFQFVIVIPPEATFDGTVWFDENANGEMESDELGIPGAIAFVDLNRDGMRDANEPSAVTDIRGQYFIRGNIAGSREVAIDLSNTTTTPFAFVPTSPPIFGVQTVDLAPQQFLGEIDFGVDAQRGLVEGVVFDDITNHGVRDPTEPGLAGVTVYVDLNDDGRLQPREPAVVTSENGAYVIPDAPPGIYPVRVVMPPGRFQTFPTIGGAIDTAIPPSPPDGPAQGVVFGLCGGEDFGDAPIAFPVTREQNGASHTVVPGFHLGERLDRDLDGIPSPDASADDAAGRIFDAPVSQVLQSQARGMISADLGGPGNGVEDAIVLLDDGFEVFLADGVGGFLTGQRYPRNTVIAPIHISTGDVSGDGVPDLIVTQANSRDLLIFLNRGDGGFHETPFEISAPGAFGSDLLSTAVGQVAFRDPANPRGRNDIVLGGDGQIAVLFNSSSLPVAVPPNTANRPVLSFGSVFVQDVGAGPLVDVAVFDLAGDGDGLHDVVALSETQSRMHQLINAGTSETSDPFARAQSTSANGRPVAMATADFNMDGRMDLAVANNDTGNVDVLLAAGGGLATATPHFVGGSPTSVAAGNFAGDDSPDILVATGRPDGVSLLINDGRGQFNQPVQNITTGQRGDAVAFVDLNADGGGDILSLTLGSATDPAFMALRLSAGDDEDGVQHDPVVAGALTRVIVNASQPGVLNAWIDFNGNNLWEAGEQIFVDRPLAAGDNTLFFVTPANAVAETVFARYRFSERGGLGPFGPADSGEVEDYAVNILATPPDGDGPPPVSPHTNPLNRLDVTDDGQVNIEDVLALVTAVRNGGQRPLAIPPPGAVIEPPFVDTNVDGLLTLNDILQVAHFLFNQLRSGGESEPEETAAPQSIGSLDPAAAGLAVRSIRSDSSSQRRATLDESDDRNESTIQPAGAHRGDRAALPEAGLSSALASDRAMVSSQRVFAAEDDSELDETLSVIAEDVAANWRQEL